MIDLAPAILLLQAASSATALVPAPLPSWTASDFPAAQAHGSALAKGDRAPARYPVEALRRREEGRTVASVRVGTDGRAIRCSISQSSGSASLDKETCRLAIQSARWRPATDTAGNPIESDATLPVTWRLPR